jgi:hypothetical protein
MSDPHDRPGTTWEAGRDEERADRDKHIADDAARDERLIQVLSADKAEQEQGD